MSKQTAYDIVMSSRKEIVDKLVSQMEQGYSFTQSLWDKSLFTPHNPVSGATYQGGNRLRLMLAAKSNGYDDPRWMTFKQAKANDYKIKPGSKGILLEKWIFTKEVPLLDENGKPQKGPDGKILKTTEELKHPVANFFYVFNGSQIEGLPELKLPERIMDGIDKIADAFIQSSKCPIYYEAQPRSYYSPAKDEIHLPLRESFKNSVAHLGVLIHEMSHSTGHESRLNRPIKNSFGTPDYAREELNAELSSFFTQSDLGLSMDYSDEHFKDHANYIKSWCQILKEHPNDLFNACTVAEGISHYLMDNYEETLELSEQHTVNDELTADQEDIVSAYGNRYDDLLDQLQVPAHVLNAAISYFYGKTTEEMMEYAEAIKNGSPMDPVEKAAFEHILDIRMDERMEVYHYYHDIEAPSKQSDPDYTETLKRNIKVNGFTPNKKIMESIQELNNLTGTQHDFLDIHKLYKEKSFSPDTQEGKLVNAIGQEFKRQEQLLKVPDMELE